MVLVGNKTDLNERRVKKEDVTLNYNAEYVASEYASDIRWFYENVKLQRCRIQTFMNGGQADFRFIKN